MVGPRGPSLLFGLLRKVLQIHVGGGEGEKGEEKQKECEREKEKGRKQ